MLPKHTKTGQKTEMGRKAQFLAFHLKEKSAHDNLETRTLLRNHAEELASILIEESKFQCTGTWGLLCFRTVPVGKIGHVSQVERNAVSADVQL